MPCTGSTEFARSLRRTMTETERRLWHKLRDRRLGGYKFARQVPIGSFFADFCCRETKLVIELDGSQHAMTNDDTGRDSVMVGQGYRVLRFWNHELSAGFDDVCETILAAVEGRLEPYERYRTT